MPTASSELVAVLGGAAISIPYVYQFDSPRMRPSKLSPVVWIGWVMGLFGVAAYFDLRPTLRNSGSHKHHHKLTDFPEAPEGIPWIAGLLALLCYSCFLRDIWIKNKVCSWQLVLLTLAGPVICGLIYILMMYLHYIIPLNSRYTAALGISGLTLGSLYLLACPAAAAHTSTTINPQNSGVHYITFLIQLLGYFVWILDLLIGYDNPDWWGITLIVYLFGGNLIFVLVTLFRSSPPEKTRTILPLSDISSPTDSCEA